jgi:cytochrome P450
MINERRSGAQKGHQSEDLLSILINSELHIADDDNLIIDELFTFFIAGMKTV